MPSVEQPGEEEDGCGKGEEDVTAELGKSRC